MKLLIGGLSLILVAGVMTFFEWLLDKHNKGGDSP